MMAGSANTDLVVANAEALRRLHERDDARQQIDAVRRALGLKLGERLDTEAIVELLRAAEIPDGIATRVEELLDQLKLTKRALGIVRSRLPGSWYIGDEDDDRIAMMYAAFDLLEQQDVEDES